MTRKEWDAMTSRERDALVAEKVMGWTNIRPADDTMRDPVTREIWEDVWGDAPGNNRGNPLCIPDYTTTPEGMMAVVEKMGDTWFHLARFAKTGHQWRAEFGPKAAFAEADTPYEAVSLAALIALGHLEEG